MNTILSDFHDYAYEASSTKADARAEYVEAVIADLIGDQRCKVTSRIDNLMEEVMERICFDELKNTRFNRALFGLFAGNVDAGKQVRLMLETEIEVIIKKRYSAE